MKYKKDICVVAAYILGGVSVVLKLGIFLTILSGVCLGGLMIINSEAK